MRLRILTIILAFPALAAVSGLRAQSLEAFKERLASPVPSGAAFGMASVSAKEYGDAARAVAEASRSEKRQEVPGYRVCIFVDNGGTAREDAMAAKTLFEEHYPGIRVYTVYRAPYFQVTVGNCLTKEEAIILKGRISAVFPKAFPREERLTLADLLESAPAAVAADSLRTGR